MSNEPTRDQIEDLKANLAYHEHQAALIRERLAGVPAANRVAEKDAATNRVAARDACPGCGERDADNLGWTGDECEQARCSTCGRVYTPPRD